MKPYLAEFFKYNDWAAGRLLETIRELPEPGEAVRLFSHLITTQNKWLNRITNEVEDATLQWAGPVISIDELQGRWRESTDKWRALIDRSSEAELEERVVFLRQHDGKKLSVKLRDIILQLNYHSIHHRAQINRLISQQGLPVPMTDYIFTVLEECD